MSDVGGPTNAGAVALAVLGVAAAALWADRRAAALRVAGVREEVKLHDEAVAAIENAHEQILKARRAADRLRDYQVTVDVRARLESAFTEELEAEVKEATGDTKPPEFLLMLQDRSQWPDLKERVDRLLQPTSPNVATTEPVHARAALLDAINAESGIWTASRALALLESRGWRTESARPVNLVGNLLGVMAREGEIARAGRGEYKSLQPTVPSSAQEEIAPGIMQPAPGAWIFDTATTSASLVTDKSGPSKERG
ncbi:hypothetical protein [Winogradskya humida]|uniref:Uncharacterized protein n=1 Tax=Winogradskya humida TaxID=113566 RepID=A0ABQ3ZVD2_9ACTN|nr:hypothetical protein [Actinoplanes humidus]GIE22528.1 hypothetical protein Ahu01nite_056300 [Actinoplanes humidus]